MEFTEKKQGAWWDLLECMIISWTSNGEDKSEKTWTIHGDLMVIQWWLNDDSIMFSRIFDGVWGSFHGDFIKNRDLIGLDEDEDGDFMVRFNSHNN